MGNSPSREHSPNIKIEEEHQPIILASICVSSTGKEVCQSYPEDNVATEVCVMNQCRPVTSSSPSLRTDKVQDEVTHTCVIDVSRSSKHRPSKMPNKKTSNKSMSITKRPQYIEGDIKAFPTELHDLIKTHYDGSEPKKIFYSNPLWAKRNGLYQIAPARSSVWTLATTGEPVKIGRFRCKTRQLIVVQHPDLCDGRPGLIKYKKRAVSADHSGSRSYWDFQSDTASGSQLVLRLMSSNQISSNEAEHSDDEVDYEHSDHDDDGGNGSDMDGIDTDIPFAVAEPEPEPFQLAKHNALFESATANNLHTPGANIFSVNDEDLSPTPTLRRTAAELSAEGDQRSYPFLSTSKTSPIPNQLKLDGKTEAKILLKIRKKPGAIAPLGETAKVPQVNRIADTSSIFCSQTAADISRAERPYALGTDTRQLSEKLQSHVSSLGEHSDLLPFPHPASQQQYETTLEIPRKTSVSTASPSAAPPSAMALLTSVKSPVITMLAFKKTVNGTLLRRRPYSQCKSVKMMYSHAAAAGIAASDTTLLLVQVAGQNPMTIVKDDLEDFENLKSAIMEAEGKAEEKKQQIVEVVVTPMYWTDE